MDLMQVPSPVSSSPVSATPPRTSMLVVTWFYDDQPGFLDFKYRIRTLSRSYAVTLVIRSERFRAEFAELDLDVLVLNQPTTGRRPLLMYCLRVVRLCRSRPGAGVMLLGSQLAWASLLMPRDVKRALYWNEHPSHFFGGEGLMGWRGMVSKVLRWGAYRGARRAHVVMPIGEAHQEDLLFHGVPVAQAPLVYMGVTSNFRREAPVRADDQPLRLVYTGTVANDRGRDVMLEGMALCRARGIRCHLTIVGASAAELALCQARLQALGLSGAVAVHGRVPGEAVPGFLAAADMGVCLWEDRLWWRFNPPTKLFEYLVAGLPVLASNIRTHTDYVRHGFNGVVFEYGAEGFAAGVAHAAAQHDALQEWAHQATTDGRRFLWSEIEPRFQAAVRRAVVT